MTKRFAALIPVLALVAAACGGTGSNSEAVASLEESDAGATSEAPQPEAEQVDPEEALLAFASCMREEGVDMGDPVVDADGNISLQFEAGGPGGADRDSVEAAREGCSVHLEGLTLRFDDADATEFEDTLLEFARCMRDNGYDMDDPDFSNLGPGGGEGSEPGEGGPLGFDPDDPAFAAAQEACSDILAGFDQAGPGPGRGGST